MDNLTELEPKKDKLKWELSGLTIRGGGLLFLSFVLLLVLLGFELNKINSLELSSWTEDQKADCAVVLTGGPVRVSEGFSLLAQKRVKKLIISGVNPKVQLHEIYPASLFYGDIDFADIILEKRSKTTFGNAQQSAVLIEALQCKDIILVSSLKHMYRAKRSFRAVLPDEFYIYTRPVVYGRASLSQYSVEGLEESLKSLFYSIWAY